MLNSLVLEHYSPILVPLSFIYGLKFTENEVLLGNINPIGLFFIVVSLLIYYDRVHKKNKEFLLAGLVLFFFCYMTNTYVAYNIITIGLTLVSLCFIAYGITDVDFSTKSQYIYLSLLLIFIGIVVFIPYERNNMLPYGMSFLVMSLGISILTFATLQLPFK